MKNYLKIYLEYAKVNFERVLEYKFDSIVGISAMLFSNISFIIMIWLIFIHVTNINGWTFPQLLFLTGLSTLIFGIWNAFLANVWALEDYVREGILDRVLVKPLNPLFQLVANRINDDGLGDVFSGIVVLIVTSTMISVNWSLFNIFVFLLSVLGGVLILFAITIILASVAFWTTRSHALLETIFHFASFTDYPLDIYNTSIKFLVSFVFPFAFVNYYPAQIFLGKGIFINFAYLTLPVGIIAFCISYAVWKFGLKNYTSTGS